jgi:glycosyltransferase involved in cell wall biosynthesis
MTRPLCIVDARCLGPTPTGVERSTQTLLVGLSRLAPADLRLAALVRDGDALPAEVRASGVVEPMVCRGRRAAVLGPRGLRSGAALLHSPESLLPAVRPSGLALVTTVHDLIPIEHTPLVGGSWKARMPRVWRAWLARQCAMADAVVCVSEHTRDRARVVLGADGGRLHVALNGLVSSRSVFQPALTPPTPDDARRSLGLPPLPAPLILALGRRVPYKNAAGLLRAFARARVLLPGAHLVLAGPADARYDPAVRADIRSLALAHAVTLLDNVRDETLPGLFAAATVFATASLAEGFGLPPLEAMAAGVPVVSSDRGALPEAVGDAAVLADPQDAGAFADALVRVCTDSDLRAHLTRAGRARAAGFTPEKQAEATLGAYRAALRRRFG